MLFYYTLYQHNKTSDLSTSNKQDSTSNNGKQKVSIRPLAHDWYDAADVSEAIVFMGRKSGVKGPSRQHILQYYKERGGDAHPISIDDAIQRPTREIGHDQGTPVSEYWWRYVG